MINSLILTFLIWFDEIETSLQIIKRLSPEKLIVALSIIGIAFLLVRLTSFFIESLSQYAPRSRFFFKMFATVIRFAISFSTGIFLVVVFAPSQQTLLTVLASVGLAVGLGAQDLIKNIIGGLVILIDRPYQLGDRVKIGDAYGEIDHIGLRSTKLTTPDDTRVTIPNSDILSGKAWNANSGVPDCQVVTDLYLPHDANPEEAVEVGYEVAYSSPFILLTKPVVVLLQDRFQDGPFMVLRIKAYVYDHRFEPRFQSDITIRAKAEFLKRGMILRWNRHDQAPTSEILREEFLKVQKLN